MNSVCLSDHAGFWDKKSAEEFETENPDIFLPHAIKNGSFESLLAYMAAELLFSRHKDELPQDIFCSLACSDPFFIFEKTPPEHLKKLAECPDYQSFPELCPEIFSTVSPMSRTYMNCSNALAQFMIKHKLNGRSTCYSGADSFAQSIDESFFKLSSGLAEKALIFGGTHPFLNNKLLSCTSSDFLSAPEKHKKYFKAGACAFYLSSEKKPEKAGGFYIRESETFSLPEPSGFKEFLNTCIREKTKPDIDLLVHNGLFSDDLSPLPFRDKPFIIDSRKSQGECFGISSGLNLYWARQELKKIADQKKQGAKALIISACKTGPSLHTLILEFYP